MAKLQELACSKGASLAAEPGLAARLSHYRFATLLGLGGWSLVLLQAAEGWVAARRLGPA